MKASAVALGHQKTHCTYTTRF